MNKKNISLSGGQQQSAHPGLRHAVSLVSSLMLLQRDKAYCDVLLQAESPLDEDVGNGAAKESRGVWAHRAVLAVVSPYFNRIFSSSFKACTKQVLVIRGVKLEILQALIENIYSATALMVSVEKAKALLAAATLLEVAEVRDAACACLQRALVVDNALSIRASAARHGCAALLAATTRYIQDHFEDVLKGTELLSLSPTSMAALLELDRLPTMELRVFDAVLRWTQYRPQERRRYLASLLRAVRLSLVPREALVERARVEPLLNAESRALVEVIEALLTDHKGIALSQPPATLVVIGGMVDDTCSSSVLACSLPGGSWRSMAALPAPRSRNGVALLDSRLYVVGGDDGSSPVRTVFIYDAGTNSWLPGPEMTSTRRWLGVTALDGRLYAVGGWNDISIWLRSLLSDRYIVGTVYNSAEALDPREGVWRPIKSMAARRRGHGVATLDGKLYAVGGYDNKIIRLNSTERYDPVAGKWETVEAMADRRQNVAVGVVDDAMYAVGGYDGSKILQTVERYRAGSGWESAPNLPVGLRSIAVAGHRGWLYAAGGSDNDKVVPTVSAFEPATGAWSELSALPSKRTTTAVVVPWLPPAP